MSTSVALQLDKLIQTLYFKKCDNTVKSEGKSVKLWYNIIALS